jgi:flagellar basal-body rod protein FlgB
MFDITSGNRMIQTMDQGLTLASKRQAFIASNLANLDTPGYRTKDFSFEGALKLAIDGQKSPTNLTATHRMHLQGSTSSSLPASTDALKPNAERNDGNDVNLDRENMLLSRTQGAYQNASTFMQVELRKLYLLIREASAH